MNKEYSEKDILNYIKEHNLSERSNRRILADKKSHFIYILYHKFKYSQEKISKLFNYKDHSIISNHLSRYIKLLENSIFLENTKEERKLFPINIQKGNTSRLRKILIDEFLTKEERQKLKEIKERYKILSNKELIKLLINKIYERL